MSIGYLFSSIGVSRIMTNEMEFIAGHFWQNMLRWTVLPSDNIPSLGI